MMSKGEQIVAKILRDNGIGFIQEFSFKDLKNYKGNQLRFDFAIIKNKKLVALIEVDGQQHFQWVKHFHKTVFEFRRAQEWDRVKNSYCLKKKIPLIRIPYWDFNNLTLTSIFTKSSYRVVNKYHNDILAREVNK